MLFWDMVKKEIAAQNTTQEWVAQKAGITHVVFRSAISKDNEPSVGKAVKIAAALGVSYRARRTARHAAVNHLSPPGDSGSVADS